MDHLYKSTQSLNRGLLIYEYFPKHDFMMHMLETTRETQLNHCCWPSLWDFFENYVCPGWEEWFIEAEVARVLPNGPLLDLVCLVNTCKIIWYLAHQNKKLHVTSGHHRTSISNPRALNTNGRSDTGPIEFQTHGPEASARA